MSDKITHIKPKTKKQETIGDIILSSAMVLNEQRKVINKKIKDIKTTLKKVEEKI